MAALRPAVRASILRAIAWALLLSAPAACGSGTAPGELKLLISGVLTSASSGQPLRFAGVTLYDVNPGTGTRSPIAAVVANMNGSYVLTVNQAGCDESRLEIEASANGYTTEVYDASADPHVRCVADPQGIDFHLSPAGAP